MGKVSQKVQASTGMLATFFGLDIKLDVNAQQNQELKFEMGNTINEATYDLEIEEVIKQALEKHEYKKDNRYFVIREAKATKKIDYELTRSLVDNLGGEAKIAEKIDSKTTVFSRKDNLNFVLKQEFNEPMRIMFKPEEITKEEPYIEFSREESRPEKIPARPIRLTPKFTRKAVTEHLEWTDGK
jgi:hypothetical protein